MKSKLKISPSIFVILGVTGDLAKRKIIPALFHLYEKGKLPKKFRVVGFSRGEFSENKFSSFIASVLKNHTDVKISKTQAEKFAKLFSYQQGFFENKGAYSELAQKLAMIDRDWGVCMNKIFYLSVSPRFYGTILKNLEANKLTEPCSEKDGWTRVLLEKPFGRDQKSARKLDQLLSKLFREEQIYRVDHYLGKEMVQSILALRFSNSLFERTWNNKFIKSIEIRLHERLGVEDRINFYDGVGALRDVGQNHVLQMLALATMDRVREYDAGIIRKNRFKLLNSLKTPATSKIKSMTFRGQYRGYKKHLIVSNTSRTETFFKIVGYINSSRWKGVPVVMESGKRMKENKKEIVFNYRHPKNCFCGQDSEHTDNKVKISLGLKKGIEVEFWTKKPGLGFEIEKQTLNFDLNREQGVNGFAEEYERLLVDAIRGDQTLFVSSDEETAAWKFIDPVLREWNKKKVKLNYYKSGSNEPVEKSKFINKDLGV